MCSSFPRPLAEDGDDSVVAPSLISNGNDDGSTLFFFILFIIVLGFFDCHIASPTA